jgi:group II intron reverse transcriptase/maturase
LQGIIGVGEMLDKANSTIFYEVIEPNNLRVGFSRVRENAGCRGSDGVTIEAFERRLDRNLRELSNDLSSGRYQPFPLLRFPVPKRKREGYRYLSVPTVRDRVAQASVYLATQELFEAEFEQVSHAYRMGRGVPTAVEEIKKWRDKGYKYAVDADIHAFFDSVDHEQLLRKLGKIISEPELLNLFSKWVRVEVYDGERIWPLAKGIPQGSVVSPMLANLFLDELDEMLISFDRKIVRYADDFLILSKTISEAEENVELTDMILDDMKLELNPTKTRIVSFDAGFKFLGAIFLHGDVWLPYPEKKKKEFIPKLPPPLNLKRYLELKNKE